MKRLFVVFAVVLPLSLAACANTTQGKLRQAVYDLDSAYHLIANPMPDVLAGKVPGVTVSAEHKLLIQSASQTVFNEISALEKSVEAGDSVTETAVAAAQADLASFTACWSGLKSGTVPDACKEISASTTSTTTASN
jgi:hypothetical protein